MKKRYLKTLITIASIVIPIIPYLYWNEKNEIQDRFDDLEFKIHQSNADSIHYYCETVSRFVSVNPIRVKVVLDCSDYTPVDSAKTGSLMDDFMVKVHEIDNDYRSQERAANTWTFIILISSLILRALMRRLIDKRAGNH